MADRSERSGPYNVPIGHTSFWDRPPRPPGSRGFCSRACLFHLLHVRAVRLRSQGGFYSRFGQNGTGPDERRLPSELCRRLAEGMVPPAAKSHLRQVAAGGLCLGTRAGCGVRRPESGEPLSARGAHVAHSSAWTGYPRAALSRPAVRTDGSGASLAAGGAVLPPTDGTQNSILCSKS